MIESPCIKVCTLDENNICLGCKRTIDEIVDWPNLTDEEKLKILKRIDNDTHLFGKRLRR